MRVDGEDSFFSLSFSRANHSEDAMIEKPLKNPVQIDWDESA
jgi:hypothetical protein